MKRLLLNFGYVFISLVLVGFYSCEGPAGDDGMDGMAGTTECMACHDSGTELKAKQVQFASGAHANGTYYSRGGQCAGCHSTEGFLDRANHTSIAQIDEMTLGDQTPIGCKTCHNVHYMYDSTDWSLTFFDQVKETLFGYASPDHASYSFADFGNANQCLQCHQARDRGNVPGVDATDSVSVSGHWGPHYGVQGNVLHAQAGVHVVGSESYPTALNGHAKLLSNACISCHMHEKDHSLAVNFAACVTCHESEDKAEDMVDALHEEIDALKTELAEKLIAKGAMVVNDEGGYEPIGGKVGADEGKAVWNYMVVYQDHSYGVHNPSYTKALLKNSIELVSQ